MKRVIRAGCLGKGKVQAVKDQGPQPVRDPSPFCEIAKLLNRQY
jgi:hypothetical protein